MTVPTTENVLFSHLSQRAKDRKLVSFGGAPLPSTLNKHPKPISLAGGRPHAEFFPVHKLSLEVVNTPAFTKKDKLNQVISSTSVEKFSTEGALDLSSGLQYGPTEGWDQLRNFTKDLIKTVNPPGFEDWDITLTNGTGDSLHKVFNLLINPGDVVLIEAYTFVPVVANIINYGGIVVPLDINFQNGLDVDSLTELLASWSENPKYKHLPKPKALYTIPTGQNPTGISVPNEKRVEILKLAKEHDFIIIEDDPYGYIQLGKYTDGETNKFDVEEYDIEEYIHKDLPNSFIQYDTEGRVLRLESFSKVFAPGTRLGFIVGYKGFIKNIVKHADVSTRASSGVSQIVVTNVVQHLGGVPGWLKWNTKISSEYTKRKNLLLKTLYSSESYKKGQFEVIEPEAGMFVIVNINFPETEDYRDSVEQLRYKTLEQGVEVVLGKNMTVDESYSKKAKFIRLTIATQDSADEIVEASSRLTRAIEAYFNSI